MVLSPYLIEVDKIYYECFGVILKILNLFSTNKRIYFEITLRVALSPSVA